jgi:hypothetical protein
MGEPISSLISEICLQGIENKIIKHAVEKGAMIYYTRYADSIFIVYNTNKITPEAMPNNLKITIMRRFTLEEKNNNQIVYIRLNLRNEQGSINRNRQQQM